MEAHRKTLARLSEDVRQGTTRVAAKGSFNKPAFLDVEDKGNPFKGPMPGTPTKRDIPANHEFDKKALKPLVKTLWAMSVALGHALTAHRSFSRLKSSSFSPDGLLGGRGYVLSIKAIRQNLFESCEQLSALCDTLHDEINAPHWKPKLAELELRDINEVEKLLGDAEDWIDNPEEEAEEEAEEVQTSSWSKGKKERFEREHDFGSKMPGGGAPEVSAPNQGAHPAGNEHPFSQRTKQASFYSYDRTANSSIAPQNEPGGPRVQHLDRGDVDQTGPGGSYNRDEPPVADEWAETDGVSGQPMSQNQGDSYAYPADWSGDFSGKGAASGVPDANTDSTPTQAWDFGIGDGNGDDAHGQAAGGYGLSNPGSPGDRGNRGVYGPRAELPDDPGGKTKDEESDSNPTVERQVSESGHMGMPIMAATSLPNDGDDPVARSDYFVGPKGNDFNGQIRAQAQLPGENPPQPQAPLKQRPSHLGEHEFSAGSEMPGDDPYIYDYGKGVGPNLMDRVEHGDQPYVKWDDTTHNMRPDYIYQRDPIQGPYPKQGM